MSLGMSSKFNILRQSPLDIEKPKPELADEDRATLSRWVPSRYTTRSTDNDGRLVLWNSYYGTMSAFTPEQKPAVESLLSKEGFEAREEGIVEYLYKRGFLIKEEVDEFQRFRLDFGRSHYRTDSLELMLLASEDCNFRCTYCYEDFSRGTMLPEVRAGVKKFVESRLKSLRTLSISWFGGEPLYGFGAIEDLAPYFLQRTKDEGVEYQGHMTTNGFLLTPEIAQKLLEWRIVDYQITLDGTPEFHNRSRPTRTGEGSFSRIFDNLKELSRRPEDFHVSLRINFDRDNYRYIPDFLDLVARELHRDPRFKVRFIPVGRWGGSDDDQLNTCEKVDGVRISEDLKEEAVDKGLGLADGFKKKNKLHSQVCYAAQPNHFVIGASGKVMKCTIVLDTEDFNVLGEITPDGKLSIDYNKLGLWTDPSFENDEKCKKCIILPICQGISCPLQRIRHQTRPCLPVRSQWRRELMLTMKEGRNTNQRVFVLDDKAPPHGEAQPGTPGW